MRKRLILLAFFLVIAVLGLAGFWFVFNKGTTVPASSETKSASLPVLNSFRGSLAGTMNGLKDKITQTLAPSGSGQPSPPVSESAAVSPSATSDFSFAIFGDTKEFSASDPNGNFEKAVAQTKNQDLSAFFVMGDLVNSCDGGSACEAKFNAWKSVMAPVLSKTYEVVGNHDRTGGDKADAVWQKEFNLPKNGPSGYEDLVYSFDIGN